MTRVVSLLQSSQHHASMGLFGGTKLAWVVPSQLTQQTSFKCRDRGTTSTFGPHQRRRELHRQRQARPEQGLRKGSIAALSFSDGIGGVEFRQQV